METEISGKLRIGDHWNAITILALSQSNPLKAIAEFVENSIDARSRHVTVVRGKTALARGFHPDYSSISLSYGAKRRIFFRAGNEAPPSFIQLTSKDSRVVE